jgi:hypothetical protein
VKGGGEKVREGGHAKERERGREKINETKRLGKKEQINN